MPIIFKNKSLIETSQFVERVSPKPIGFDFSKTMGAGNFLKKVRERKGRE